MGMTLEEFREDIINDFNKMSIVNQDYPVDFFIEYVKDILINDFGLISDLNEMYYDWETSNKKFKNMRIDASYLELSINTLHLLYADYNSADLENFNTEYVRQKSTLLTNYFDNVLRGFFDDKPESDPVTQLAKDIRKNIDSINKIHVIIASTNKYSSRIKTTIEIKPIELGGKKYNVDLTLLDIEKIYQTKLQGFKKDDIEIDTKDYGIKGIPCIKADINANDYEAYLAIVPGKFLNDIYQKYSARLLESNVRSFLNTRGEINKGILNTILNDKSRFFAYNNGISTTADDVKFVNNSDGLYITHFKNLQIINGGQTTASLASAVIKNNADLDGIYVQMKLSIIKENEDRPELVRLISKYANKQNKVTNADLNSNHPFYARIEEFSRKIKTPIEVNSTIQSSWFFERARGQYDQAKMKLNTKKEKELFELQNPKKQKFTKMDLAKYINCDELKPYHVSWGAEVNMMKFQANIEKDWEKSNTKYNEIYYKELISKAILFKTIEKIISNSEWYINNKGYRAQLVAYTFSKFIYEIQKLNKKFNYKRIWELQEIPEVYFDDLAEIAKICYDVFNDPKRQYLNIGEYTKREICWTTVLNKKYELSEETKNLLVDKEDIEVEKRIAQKDQRFDNEICSEIDIFNAGIEYWNKVKSVGEQLNELSLYQLRMCDTAIKYIKQIYPELKKTEVKCLIDIMKKMNQYL